MGRKKAMQEEPQAETTTTRKARKLDVDELRALADQCPSKAAGELLIESIDTYVTAKAAYKIAAKNLRQDAARAKSRAE
jgi:hypothetical protein